MILEKEYVELLSVHLEAFVTIEIKELERQGGVTSWHIEEAQRRIATIRASGESEALFYCFDKGKTRRTMGILVECLAVLAFNPGGVTAYGCHFEVVESQWITSEV